MLKKFISLGDIKKSLKTLNEFNEITQDLNNIELTKSFFQWIVDCEYDLNTAIHNVDSWIKQDYVNKKYIEQFLNGEFNQFLKLQTWAEQMEDGDN